MPERRGRGDFVALGTIVNTHGIRGELRLLSHNPESDLLAAGSEVVLRRRDATRAYTVSSARRHKRFVLLVFAGVDSMDEAEKLVGAEVAIDADALPPAGDGEVYHVDLIGLRVVTTGGEEIGAIEEILSTAAHDVCVVRAGGREVLIPYVDDFIREVDLDAGRLVIEPVPGLLD